MSVPQSKIYICAGVKLNNRYDHTIHFDSVSAQREFFMGKVVKTFTGYSYLRKSWNIKVEAQLSSARSWDYLFFENADGKTWYYFINNVEYINDNTVELILELDVMQTYLKDYTLLKCFVEREHVKDDTIGANTVDEGLEFGDYTNSVDYGWKFNSNLGVLVLSTFDLHGVTEDWFIPKAQTNNIENVFHPMCLTFVPHSKFSYLQTKLNWIDEDGKSDGIVSMWMYPAELLDLEDVEGSEFQRVKGIANPTYCYEELAQPTTYLGGGTPRHNKLLTFPYNFLYATNSVGQSAIYKYERFGDPSSCRFQLTGGASPEAGVTAFPLNYEGTTNNYEAGIQLKGFPVCAWNQDAYKLWLAQNQAQHDQSYMESFIQAGIGAMTAGLAIGGALPTAGASLGALGAGGGMILNAFNQVQMLNAQHKDKEVQPPQSKGNHSANVALSVNQFGITIKRKCIRPEWIERLESFFDLYGYKVCALKTPSTNNREAWTYTKTVGCHISGKIPCADQTKIESIFDKGITFWKNGNKICDYSQSNNPI